MQLTLLLEPERIYPGAAGALALSIVTITTQFDAQKRNFATRYSQKKKLYITIYYLHMKQQVNDRYLKLP